MTERKHATVEALRKMQCDLIVHLNQGRMGHRYTYRSVDWPEVMVLVDNIRKHRDDPQKMTYKTIVVGDDSFTLQQLQEACDAINAITRTMAEGPA